MLKTALMNNRTDRVWLQVSSGHYCPQNVKTLSKVKSYFKAWTICQKRAFTQNTPFKTKLLEAIYNFWLFFESLTLQRAIIRNIGKPTLWHTNQFWFATQTYSLTLCYIIFVFPRLKIARQSKGCRFKGVDGVYQYSWSATRRVLLTWEV